MDPVIVSGYRDREQEPWFMRGNRVMIDAETLCIRVPGTYVYITDTHRQGHADLSVAIPVHSQLDSRCRDMTIDRSSLLRVIDRCILYCEGAVPLRLQESFRGLKREFSSKKACLMEWRTELVASGVQRRWAARTIQKQFRESLSNPEYVLCRRRLLHEFKELVAI